MNNEIVKIANLGFESEMTETTKMMMEQSDVANELFRLLSDFGWRLQTKPKLVCDSTGIRFQPIGNKEAVLVALIEIESKIGQLRKHCEQPDVYLVEL